MDIIIKILLALLAASSVLGAFFHAEEVEEYKRLIKAWSELAHALVKKCEAQEELIQTQEKYIKRLEETYEQRKAD